MRLFTGIALFLLAVSPARAEVHVDVTAEACQHIPGANYVEPPGVEYQPGVDVNGNPVTPADIGAPAVKLPQKFSLTITDYLAGRLGSTTGNTTQTAGIIQPQLPIGVVTYDHGRLTFNGQPIGDTDAVSELCQQAASQ